MTRTWKLKKDRRDAAVAFLQKTLTDPDVCSAVLKDRKAAHQLFEREGGIDIPDDVEVICVGPSTQERDRLVVFVLPPEGTAPENLDPLSYWVAGWIPYEMDPMKASAHPRTRTWKLKNDRRDAATAFLQKTLTDPDVRSAVLKDREAAHKLFEREGGINIPDDVEVVCVGPSTQERDRLVVFVLPPEGTALENLDPLKYWIAAWMPYEMDPIKASAHRDREPELSVV
jgi:uroporphyrinogen-III synthase